MTMLAMILGFAQVQAAAPAPPTTETPPPAAPLVHVSPDEGLSVRSTDGNFLLRLGIQSQFRYELRVRDGDVDTTSFNAQMVRPQLRGHVFRPWITYFVQAEVAGTGARMLDYQIDVQPWPWLGLRVGQFVPSFSRAFMTPVPVLQFPDFSYAEVYFRADRDLGAMLHGAVGEGRFEYYAGVYNGNGMNRGGNDKTSMMLMARLAWNPLGALAYTETPTLAAERPWRFGVALNAYADTVNVTRQVVDPMTSMLVTQRTGDQQNTTAGAEFTLRGGPFSLVSEGYLRWLRKADGTSAQQWGAFAQLALMLPGQRVELGARFNALYTNMDSSNAVLGAEALATWYVLGNHLKAQLRYAFVHADVAAANYAPGTYNGLTVQTQIAF